MKIQVLLVLYSFLFLSCKSVDTDRDGLAKCGSEICVYEIRLATGIYVVNDIVIGKSESKLREYLALQKKGSVFFRSECGLTPKTRTNLKNILVEEGFQIKQFLVRTLDKPNSNLPDDWVDLADEATDKDNDKTCDYEIRLYSEVYTVNDIFAGSDSLSLQDYLIRHEKGIIIFHSEYKLTSEGIARYKEFFTGLGFHIEQFWTPRSTFPGCVDETQTESWSARRGQVR